MAEACRLTAYDLANMLAMEPAEITAAPEGLEYRELEPSEAATTENHAREILSEAKLTIAGPAMIGRWQRGWDEILDRVHKNGVSEATLAPQYFRHEVFRLDGRYIRAAKAGFELRLYAAIRAALFPYLFSGLNHVTEFGCGTGLNLFHLNRLLPGLKIIGTDWAESSQELVSLIANAESADMEGIRFDMGTLKDSETLVTEPGSGIMTLHAMEQLGTRFGRFLDYLISLKPAAVLHLEPIAELYDEADPFDRAALAYHRKRGYLEGFLPALEARNAAGDIEILKIHRTGFGSTFHEAYSIIVWRAA